MIAPARSASRGARRGSTLIIAILVLLVMTIAGVALMFNTSTENALAGNETRMSKAFYAADSGIQYAVARMTSDINYVGGALPSGGLPSNTPGKTGNDIPVVVAPPITLGYIIRPGDEIQAQGSSYGTTQTIEAIYRIEATSSSEEIRASKVITAQVYIYPQQLRLE